MAIPAAEESHDNQIKFAAQPETDRHSLPTAIQYCLFIQYFTMSSRDNPRRLITDKEGIIAIIEQGRLNSVIITAELGSRGREALRKFLRYYVKEEYGNWKEWTMQAEAAMRRISALKRDPFITASPDQTNSGEAESMYVKWNYFYWYVEPKDGIPVHPYDKAVSKRIIQAHLDYVNEMNRLSYPPARDKK